MKGIDINMKNYLFIDLKIMFRIPLSVFFSVVYPILMMFIIILSYGNISIGDGYYLIDKYFMIAIGMGILPLTLISFPMWLANSFENNSIERLNFFGVKTSKIFIGDVLSHLVLACITTTINILFAYVVFGLRFPRIDYLLAFLLQYAIAVIVAMIIGGVFALMFKNTQILMPFGLVVMFVLYMFCGVFISFEEMPSFFQKVADILPIKYAMNDFFDICIGKIYWNKSFLILSAIYFIVGCTLIFIIIVRGRDKSRKEK